MDMPISSKFSATFTPPATRPTNDVDIDPDRAMIADAFYNHHKYRDDYIPEPVTTTEYCCGTSGEGIIPSVLILIVFVILVISLLVFKKPVH